jgi:hypothetical protein
MMHTYILLEKKCAMPKKTKEGDKAVRKRQEFQENCVDYGLKRKALP